MKSMESSKNLLMGLPWPWVRGWETDLSHWRTKFESSLRENYISIFSCGVATFWPKKRDKRALNALYTITHCTFGPIALKSVVWYISKKYLTTNEPYQKRVQKILKIRKLYSPDPDSGSGIRKIWDKFFS